MNFKKAKSYYLYNSEAYNQVIKIEEMMDELETVYNSINIEVGNVTYNEIIIEGIVAKASSDGSVTISCLPLEGEEISVTPSGEGESFLEKKSGGWKIYKSSLIENISVEDINYPPVISDLSAPTGVKASDGESRIWVRISWNSVSGASHYKVYRATSQNGAKTGVTPWQADTVAYDYGDFSTDPYYYFVKAATDSSGSNASPYSDYDIGWFKEKDLVVPTIYDPGYSVDSGVPYTVSWSDESTNGASKYNIMESTPTSGKVYEGNGTSKEFVHDVDEDTTYYYKVRAYYENEGWSEYSDKVDIVIKADST